MKLNKIISSVESLFILSIQTIFSFLKLRGIVMYFDASLYYRFSQFFLSSLNQKKKKKILDESFRLDEIIVIVIAIKFQFSAQPTRTIHA